MIYIEKICNQSGIVLKNMILGAGFKDITCSNKEKKQEMIVQTQGMYFS